MYYNTEVHSYRQLIAGLDQTTLFTGDETVSRDRKSPRTRIMLNLMQTLISGGDLPYLLIPSVVLVICDLAAQYGNRISSWSGRPIHNLGANP